MSSDPIGNFQFSGSSIDKLLEDECRLFSGLQLVFDGTVRACTPEQTLARVLPLASAMGITRIARVGDLDTLGLPISIAYRPHSRHLSSGQGKGLTQAFADASAVMECIEGFHIEQPAESALQGCHADLRGRNRMVDPSRLSPGYFAGPDLDHWAFDWVAATNLLDGDTVYLPACLTTLDFSLPVREAHILSLTANGLASGNLLAEAIGHGIMEVVERQCLAVFNASSREERNARRLNQGTLTSGPVTDTIARFQEANLEVNLWDMTDDLGISSINCAVIDRDPCSSLGWHGGSGTHFHKDIAVMRALTEAAQARAVWISGSRDDLFPDRYDQQVRRKIALANPTPLPPGPLDFARTPSGPAPESFHVTLKWLVQQLDHNGFHQVLVVNHTRPEFNVPVVQVFIPGMRIRHDR